MFYFLMRLHNYKYCTKYLCSNLFVTGFSIHLNKMCGRSFHHLSLSKNIEIISNSKIIVDNKHGKIPLITNSRSRPLVIILSWILAEKKHLQKFWEIYLAKNFDVISVSITVKQLLWPASGAQVVAQYLLDFLHENPTYDRLLLHGFSVGGYVWGEVLVKMYQDRDLYEPLLKRIVGQIWDSTPDVKDIHKGFPRAVFPNSPVLRNIFEKIILKDCFPQHSSFSFLNDTTEFESLQSYNFSSSFFIKVSRRVLQAFFDVLYIRYIKDMSSKWFHLTTFHYSTTHHYTRASQLFHNTPVRAPVLIFVAENDTIASLQSISKAKDTWESLGITTYLKSWKNSKHVSHFHLHREEYLQSLESFLSKLNVPHTEEIHDKVQAKL